MVHRHAPAKAVFTPSTCLKQAFQPTAFVARELAPARLRSRRNSADPIYQTKHNYRHWDRFAVQREQAPSPQKRYMDPNPSVILEISLSKCRIK